MSSFDKAFNFIIKAEGGFVNDPDDPGGMTKYGISKRQYPTTDIRNLTLQQAKEIYRSDYWDACKCEDLPLPLRLAVFDSAVNQGKSAAIKLLQKVVGTIADGIIGPQTINATNRTNSIVPRYLAERALRYSKTKNFNKYGRGWMKRLFDVALEK